MALAAGTRVGPYEIVDQIGIGGMGEVYRARDVNLGRHVALKVLPDAFAQDAERLARFEREAKTLASLNHPNIAIVHGFEKSDGVRALVMELVEGPTLADLIDRRSASSDAPGHALPIDEAIPITKQIAEALEAAHEQGIIHRDLKPANIKVRDDGAVKVLDFGLAKIVEESGRLAASTYAGSKEQDPAYTVSPTITTPAMTQIGVILGTAAYMAPEQARGKAVDKRSDIWAFGCVLFEMLTGRRAFEGEDTTDTIAAVVRAEPEWDALPADVPQSIRLLLRRCLEKDRKKRIGDISTALFIMSESTLVSAPTILPSPAEPAPQLSKWRSLAWSAIAVVVASTGAAGITWMVTRPDPPRVARFELTTSGASALSVIQNGFHLAITRDGSKVVYVGGPNGADSRLFVRSIDRLEPALLADRGSFPFVSPDGEWVGFVAGSSIRKVAITGGPSIEVTKLDGFLQGAVWDIDDTIIFSMRGAGLYRVPAGGGTPVTLTKPEKGIRHVVPRLVEGGRAVLFTIVGDQGNDRSTGQIGVLDLRSPGATPKVVIRGGTDARYLPSGHLVYLADNSLRAVRFDVDRLEARGAAVPVLASVAVIGTGGLVADYDIADDGTLAYLPGGGATSAERLLTWVDRGGKEEPIPAPAHPYLYPRLSLDGTRVAIDVRDQENDIWVWDLVRGGLTRVTKDAALDRTPVWAADGQSIFFSSTRDGSANIFRRRADGAGGIPERLTQSSITQFPLSASSDGSLLVFREGAGGQGGDLMALQTDIQPRPSVSPSDSSASGASSKPSVRALVKNGADNGVISPDGRWLAYQSNESGNWDIYVRPMHDLERGARSTVSTVGGTQPRWSRNGQELFYLSPRNEMMSVRVSSGEAWSSGKPMKLFDASAFFVGGTGSPFFSYDVAKDGRFLMIKPKGGATTEGAQSTSLIVVQNWFEEVKRLVPAK